MTMAGKRDLPTKLAKLTRWRPSEIRVIYLHGTLTGENEGREYPALD